MASRLDPSSHPFIFISIITGLLSLFFDWSWLLSLVPFLSSSFISITPYVFNARTGISYRGTFAGSVEHFQDIFYAESTSGSNRFAPPVPYMPQPGTVVDATTSGAFCPQAMGPAPLPFTSPITNVSENCLSLRIARPVGYSASANLPVIVWLHGGGNVLGSASDQLYQPDGLVQQAKANGQPVIFVGINYRLGIFGYATNKALRDAKQANAGLRDQRAAFDWVRDNIEAFGGDPDNVTAIGQSVGASSIGLHLVSYSGARGVPFQKAIMMSGASGLNFNIMSDLVASNTATVARSLDCIEDGPDSEATLACLRSAPLEKLINVSVTLARETRPPFGELAFYPSYDGDYITDRPSILLRKGHFVKGPSNRALPSSSSVDYETGVPLIASWVANDGAWYASPSTPDDESVLGSFSTFIIGLSEASKKRLLGLYPLSSFSHLVRPNSPATAQYYRAAQMNRDLWFTCPVIDFTNQYSKHASPPARLYTMNQTKFTPMFETMGLPFWRVSHLSDIPYILNHDVPAGDNSPENRNLSALLAGSAAAFAYTADPTASLGRPLGDWSLAYENQNFNADQPDAMTVYIFGGPHGTGAASVSTLEQDPQGARGKALAQERILERCAFINSILDEIGV